MGYSNDEDDNAKIERAHAAALANDYRGALLRELEGYERYGKTDEAKAVKAELARHDKSRTERAVPPAAETR